MPPAGPPYGAAGWPPPNRPGYPPGQAPSYPPGYSPGYPQTYAPGYPSQAPPGWTTRAPPPKPQNVWRKIPAPIRIRLAVGVAIVFLILIATAFSPQQGQGAPSIRMTPSTWQNGTLAISISDAQNTGGLLPSGLSYEIFWQAAILFTGPAGSYQPEPNVTVTVRYDDRDGNNRVTLGDSVSITVDPSSYMPIHGRQMRFWYQSTVIGFANIP